MANPQNLQWSLSGEMFWSIWRVLLRAFGLLSTQTLLAQKGTCTEANIIPPYLQPFHPGLCTMSFTVFRQKGEAGMWANFAHLDLRATHTFFPSVLPRSRGFCSWCKTLLHVCTYNTARITASWPKHCSLGTLLSQSRNGLLRHISSSEWYLGSGDCKMLPWSSPHCSSVVVFYEYLWIF